MSFHAWTIFAVFWLVFVTSPGPNAVNCVTNGMTYGFRRAYWGVLGILTQASLFLCLSALGVTALIAASPQAFFLGKTGRRRLFDLDGYSQLDQRAAATGG